jgi:hypothetical protein
MKEQISVSIPTPCSEKRENMKPVIGGHYCNVCAKTVVDFTLMSDEQVLQFLKQQGSKSFCGQFGSSQLDRPLIHLPKTSLRLIASQKLAACLFVLQGLVSGAQAQVKGRPVKMVQVSHQTPNDGYVVTGRLLDYETGAPIPNIRVWAGDSSALTNKQGKFRIHVSPSLVDGQQLEVKAEQEQAWAKATSVIPSQSVTLSKRDQQPVLLYRYAQQLLPQQKIEQPRVYSTPIIDPQNYGGLVEVRVGGTVSTSTIVRRENFWMRLSSIFKRKNRSHD